MWRSYCSKRLSVRVSITSRNPAVVTSAVLAPRRSIRALVARVVPWMICAISSMATPSRLVTAAIPARIPSSGRSWVVSTFVDAKDPSARSRAISVKVPPTSTPIRGLVIGEAATGVPGYRSSTAGKVPGGMMSTVAERCWASIPPSTRSVSPVM